MNLNLFALGYPLGLGLAAMGCGLGIGKAVAAAMEAMGRQPEAIAKIQTAMVIGAAFIEALTIYIFVLAFTLGNKLFSGGRGAFSGGTPSAPVPPEVKHEPAMGSHRHPDPWFRSSDGAARLARGPILKMLLERREKIRTSFRDIERRSRTSCPEVRVRR
jgi:F-type H+-transporting ATPase subunit c